LASQGRRRWLAVHDNASIFGFHIFLKERRLDALSHVLKKQKRNGQKRDHCDWKWRDATMR